MDEILTEKHKKYQKVIIFNGPPGVGKDTLGYMLYTFMQEHKLVAFMQSFKKPLIDIALAVSGVDRATWVEWYTQKEKPRKELGGLSCRQFLIKISEETIKPSFGQNYFGVRAANDLCEGVNIFTDGGFVPEVEPLIKKVGIQNVIIIQLSRDGHTFAGDSRSYINIKGCPTFKIINNDLDKSFPELLQKLGFIAK